MTKRTWSRMLVLSVLVIAVASCSDEESNYDFRDPDCIGQGGGTETIDDGFLEGVQVRVKPGMWEKCWTVSLWTESTFTTPDFPDGLEGYDGMMSGSMDIWISRMISAETEVEAPDSMDLEIIFPMDDLSPDVGELLTGFWWDEPAGDNKRCYHTENQQIIFHSDELLAGQYFEDRTFQNSGKDGRYHIEHALRLIRRWIKFRVQFGFSEWLSNCYFEEDLLALVNLYDFARDPEIRRQAGRLIDVILFEMALHTYRGVFGSTHGRTYARLIKGGRGESPASTAKLMFGMGLFTSPSSLGTVPLATSTYRCLPIIEAIAADFHEPQLFQERHSLDIADAPQFGLSYDNVEDGHLFWSIQDYVHPNVIELSKHMSATYGVRLFEDYQARYDALFQWQIDEHGEILDPDMDCHAMTEVHIQTYRTPDYMLSCAQDYRPGKPGYQQHIWQATLGIDAVVFTNHPGAADEISRPNYWAGNGVMPRAAQHQNVLACIYHAPPDDAFPFSHAYFPRAAFDEVVERDNWVFARKDDGYIALYSQHPLRWLTDNDGTIVEARAESPDNVWLVEMGRRAEWGTFAAFVEVVASSAVRCKEGLRVSYESPSVGNIDFGWKGPLSIAGESIALHDYPRFDNPYCQCAFASPTIRIQRGEDVLKLDFSIPINSDSSPGG